MIEKHKISDHFIYNSLSKLDALILSNNGAKASRLLGQLSWILRKVLKYNRQEKILVERELELTTLYLRIEQTRYDHCFEYQVTNNEENLSAKFVRPFLFQQITEVAFSECLILNPLPTRILLLINFKERETYEINIISDLSLGLEIEKRIKEKINHIYREQINVDVEYFRNRSESNILKFVEIEMSPFTNPKNPKSK